MGNGRGEIHNRERAKQINNFNGLVYGSITPTDVDGLIDFHGKCFVIIECKYKDTPLPHGQRQAFERIIQSLNKPAVCIVATHDMSANLDVNVSDCLVREYFSSGKWRAANGRYSVKRMIDEFVSRHAPECLHLRAMVDDSAIMRLNNR